MQPIRTAILGLGKVAVNQHCRKLAALEEFELVAGCDLSEERLKVVGDEYDVEGYTDYAALLARDDLELVIVCTPSSAHAANAIQAAEAGKHVVVEKPLCMNLAECDAMLAAARSTGVTLSCHQNRRWDSDFLTAKAAVESGKLGDIVAVKRIGHGFNTGMVDFGVAEFRPQWRSEAQYGGGQLYDWGAHWLDQVLLLIDSPVVGVYGELRCKYWSTDADDYFSVLLQFANGVTAQVEKSAFARLGLNVGYYLLGSQGCYHNGVLVGNEDDELLKAKAPAPGGAKNWEAHFRSAEKYRLAPVKGDAADYYRNLYQHLRHGADLAVPPAQTRRLMQVLDAVFQSSASGQVVTDLG